MITRTSRSTKAIKVATAGVSILSMGIALMTSFDTNAQTSGSGVGNCWTQSEAACEPDIEYTITTVSGNGGTATVTTGSGKNTVTLTVLGSGVTLPIGGKTSGAVTITSGETKSTVSYTMKITNRDICYNGGKESCVQTSCNSTHVFINTCPTGSGIDPVNNQ